LVLVGGGTAGCLLAGRLSEKYNVLLLEAGGSPVPMSQVPYYGGAVSRDLKTNYLFRSIPHHNNDLPTDEEVDNSTHICI